jgi:hypothetical protein
MEGNGGSLKGGAEAFMLFLRGLYIINLLFFLHS